MSTVQKFEDLICWQKARELAREVYKALKDCKDFGFKDQIQRAAVSVLSNIAEGFERGTQAELLNYLFIAKGSAGEVRAQSYVALDAGYLNVATFKLLNELAAECSRLVHNFSLSVKGSDQRGLQFKSVPKTDSSENLMKEKYPDLYQKFYARK